MHKFFVLILGLFCSVAYGQIDEVRRIDYYDKSINELKKHFAKEKKDFVTIGLAYSLQETKSIPHEAHDEQLDFIITEKKLLSKINES